MNALYDKSKFRQGEKIKKLEEENKELRSNNYDLREMSNEYRETILELNHKIRNMEDNRKTITTGARYEK